MIKLTNLQIENIVTNSAVQTATKKSLPVKTSYWLAKILDKVSKEYKYFMDAKIELGKKYGKKDEKGEVIIDKATGNINIEDFTGFQTALKELLELEIEIDIDPITLPEENLTFTVEEMLVLLPLVEMKE